MPFHVESLRSKRAVKKSHLFDFDGRHRLDTTSDVRGAGRLT